MLVLAARFIEPPVQVAGLSGAVQATGAQLRQAAAATRLDEVVERHPDGWRSRTGEGGVALSGGERQQVARARALLKNAPIVLLDEATSSLDPQNEAAVGAGVRELVAEGRSVVVVAHRIATVRHADRILFLDGGRLVEAGDHEALLAAGGRYADFWRERRAAAGWTIRP